MEKRNLEMQSSKINYFVAECMEDKNMGKVYENIPNIQEASNLFQKLRADGTISKMMGNGIGVEIDGRQYPLYDTTVYDRHIEDSYINGYVDGTSATEIMMDERSYPEIAKIPEIQKAVEFLKSNFESEKAEINFETKETTTSKTYGNTPSIFEEVASQKAEPGSRVEVDDKVKSKAGQSKPKKKTGQAKKSNAKSNTKKVATKKSVTKMPVNQMQQLVR